MTEATAVRWVARLVLPPFSEKDGRRFHGGQLVASAGHLNREAALSAAAELIKANPVEWSRGAHAIVERGFYSGQSATVRTGRLEWNRQSSV